MNYRDIRNRFRLIPFGKFSISGRGKAPFNQVYVGRRKERAAFIELLTHQKNFGAFLISGRRGSGKSSFVEYALEEYRRSSFHRFIRFARSNKWPDATAALFFALIVSVIIVVIGQAVEFSAQNAFLSAAPNTYFANTLTWSWVPLFLLSGVSSLFFLYIWYSVRAVAATYESMIGDFFAALVGLFAIFGLGMLTLYGSGWISDFVSQVMEVFRAIGDFAFSHRLMISIGLAISAPLVGAFPFWEIRGPLQRVGWKMPEWVLALWKFRYIFFCLAVSFMVLLPGMLTGPGLDRARVSGISIGITCAILAVTALYLADAITQNIPIAGNRAQKNIVNNAASKSETTKQVMSSYVGLKFGFGLLSCCRSALAGFIFLTFFSFYASIDPDNQRLIEFSYLPLLLFLSALTAASIKFANELHIDSRGDVRKSWRARWFVPILSAAAVAVIAIYVFASEIAAISNLETGVLEGQEKLAQYLPYANIFMPFMLVLVSLFFRYGIFRGALKGLWMSKSVHAEPTFYDSPPVRLILHIKSYFLFLIGVSFAFPLVSLIVTLTGLFPGLWKILPLMAGQTHLQATNILTILLFLISIFFAEYQWISRALRTERQDESITPLQRRVHQTKLHGLWPDIEGSTADTRNALKIDPDARGPLWTRRREVARDLERATLAFHFYDARVPIITTWINLGFDDLRHARIVEAMLVELRAKYAAKFISITSKIGLASRIIIFLAILILTKHMAAAFFHVGPMLEKADQGWTIEQQYSEGDIVPDELNYCRLFQTHREIAPVLAGAICLMPYSNQLFEILYTPILSAGVDFALVDTRELHDKRVKIEKYGYHFVDKTAGKNKDNVLHNGVLCSSYVHDKTMYDKTENLIQFCTGSLAKSTLLGNILDYNMGLPYVLDAPSERKTEAGSVNIRETFDVYHPTGKNTCDLSLDVNQRCDESKVMFDKAGFPTLRVYHFLLFALLVLAGRLVNSFVQIFPYRARVAEMSRLIDLIRGRVTYSKNDMPRVGWLQWLLGLNRRDETIETLPDARIIEQSFISLLQKTTDSSRPDNYGFWNWFETHPEVVFVFDEMDKLTGKVDAEASQSDEAITSYESNALERQRSMQLQQLLLSMKRLLSSNSARFIFIGGRLYHDEWLADQANRTPLLTSIFSGQIYLPSLLTDREDAYGRFNDRIGEFFVLMYRNATHRFRYWRNLRYAPAFFGSGKMRRATYIQSILPFAGHPRRLAAMASEVGMQVYDESGQRYRFSKYPATNDQEHLGMGGQETIEQLLNFLTYRSAGNPKKLKEIIQSLILPSSKAFDLPRYGRRDQYRARWKYAKKGSHHDVILLDDKTIYRIQFVDVLYRHLSYHLEGRMLERDDKVAMSLFYLMDFLLKFHNRGFSWTNLQRVDELSHIHRAPDLRSMMGELVDVSSERFLHRILNGVHTFRFRSDFAREVDYLSRISKEEMAALNFTLDESQSLKGLYQQTVHTGHRENIDTIAGLGELYEYDQDYEIARNYYRQAIAVLDRTFVESTSTSIKSTTIVTPEDAAADEQSGLDASLFSNVAQVIQSNDNMEEFDWRPLGFVQNDLKNPRSQALIRSNFTWAISRLRLMLQIGQTYEQETNYERALASYMHSHRFSQAILKATAPKDTGDDTFDERTISAVNYSILYQAGMAAAWIFEKDGQDIDDSINLAEHHLGKFYESYPILRSELQAELPKDLQHFRRNDSTLMLIIGDLHNRLGDLYFFKGKQALRSVKSFRNYRLQLDHQHNVAPRFGYLLQTHNHYALSIWHVRNYMALRQMLSQTRLNILSEPDDGEENFRGKPTIHSDGLFPNLLSNSLTNSFTDMSEAVLARASIGGLLKSFTKYPSPINCDNSAEIKAQYLNFRAHTREKIEIFTRGLPETKTAVKKDALMDFTLFYTAENKHKIFGREIDGGEARDWIGEEKWPVKSGDYGEKRSLKFNKVVGNERRLNAYIFFSTTAAKIYGLGGYLVDSANEYTLQADTAISILSTISQANWMAQNGSKTTKSKICDLIFPRPPKFKKYWQGDDFLWEDFGLSRKKSCRNFFPPRLEEIEKYVAAYKILRKENKALRKKFMGSPSKVDESFYSAQCSLGLVAFTALKKAASLMQLSARPSATQAGPNHGNLDSFLPDERRKLAKMIRKLLAKTYVLSDVEKKAVKKINDSLARCLIGGSDRIESLAKVLAQLSDIDICEKKITLSAGDRQAAEQKFDKIRARHKSLQDLQDDFDLSQPWQNDPRILSLGAKLVLSLVADNKGQPAKVATVVYDEFLVPLGSGLFPERLSKKWTSQDTQNTFSGLYRLIERYRYPVLNRLHTLTTLINSAVILGKRIIDPPLHEDHPLVKEIDWPTKRDEIIAQNHPALVGRLCKELAATTGIYDSEMHFSPYIHGTSAAMAYFYCTLHGHNALYDNQTEDTRQNKKVCEFQQSFRGNSRPINWANTPDLSAALFTKDALGKSALNLLRRSEQMFSMGKAYYENIGQMQYLNDDFNDRVVHFNHAKRMLFSEFIYTLASSVHDDLYPRSRKK